MEGNSCTLYAISSALIYVEFNILCNLCRIQYFVMWKLRGGLTDCFIYFIGLIKRIFSIFTVFYKITEVGRYLK